MSSAGSRLAHAPQSERAVVADVEVIDVALPRRRDWRWRGMHEDLGQWSVVRLTTTTGIVGWGEATPLGSWGGDGGRYFGETPVTVRHVIEGVLSPILRGADPFELHSLRERMAEAIKGHVYAKAAVEMALYDIQGKLTDLPLAALLGGHARDGVPVAHMIGIMDVGDAVQEAVAAADEGIRTFQLKGTGALERDVALVRSVRNELGNSVTLRLDANQGYRRIGAKAAMRAVRVLEDAGADMVEQPTEGIAQMAAVRAGVKATIIADESCWQPADLVEIGRRDAADAISIYISKAGGIDGARQVADLARTMGLPCDINGSLESGIGNAANVQFAVAAPAVTLACVIPVTTIAGDAAGPAVAGRYFADDLVAESFTFSDGVLRPPPGPGLGVVVDEQKLERYRVS
jgi:L-alanine-DL-glutamate epimerase-like enolase superfamily enzyme